MFGLINGILTLKHYKNDTEDEYTTNKELFKIAVLIQKEINHYFSDLTNSKISLNEIGFKEISFSHK